MRSLTIYIPGLLGPETLLQQEDLPSLPAMNWCLSRANRRSQLLMSPSYRLCHLFGMTKAANADLPIAAISRLSDDNQPPQGDWLRADPVHVSADRDGLILLDATRFTLSQHDALALAADINQVLAPRGLALEVPVPYRWYIRLAEAQQLITTPVDRVVGKDVLPFMPEGDDRIFWIQLLNEIQMTLHASEVNQHREQDGQLPVNSVWFWGTGTLPDLITRKWSLVISDDMLTKGLAMLAATPFRQLPDSLPAFDEFKNGFNCLVTFQKLQKFNYYHDLEGWFEALMELEENWFEPLRRSLKRNCFDQIEIQTDTFIFTLTPASRFRIWKKRSNLLTFKEAAVQ